jgi:SAM-dependent methyltransferase
MGASSSTIAHYDRIADEYDATLAAASVKQALRKRFQALALQHIPTGSDILDFGAGTGLDIPCYLERGHRVVAYDPSDGMIGVLRSKHGDDHRVIALDGSFDSLCNTLAQRAPFQAVAANFAVLNHIAEMRQFFTAIARHIAPGGYLIASVQNAYHWRAITHRWWWDAAVPFFRSGILHINGRDQTLFRHAKWRLAKDASPSFSLSRYYAPRVPGMIWADGFRFVVWRRN